MECLARLYSSLHQEGVAFFSPSIEPKFVDKTTFGDTDMFNAQLVAALPDGCSSLHQEGVGFLPSIEPKFADKTTLGDTEIFNAQLVAALPDGCSSLHQEGVGFCPPSIEQKFVVKFVVALTCSTPSW